jgi:hypothetical protein
MTYRLAPMAPAPGITVPGVGVPAPTEEQATQAAVDYGWLIAVVIIGAVLLAIGRMIIRQINFKLLGALVLVGFIAYQVGKGGS